SHRSGLPGGSGGTVSFFFQAKDGIRAFHVTGVQTCALPISGSNLLLPFERHFLHRRGVALAVDQQAPVRTRADAGIFAVAPVDRSEERRVGRERRARWARDRWSRARRRAKGMGA